MNTPGAFEAAGYVAILGFFGTAIALVLFNKLIQISGPLTASSVTYIMPVISVLWGLADGELFGLVQGIGLFSILLGVYIVNKK
jgi:drug/metabolite transporter (DMT)-like permease